MPKMIKLRATGTHPKRTKGEVYVVSALQAASDTYQRHAEFEPEPTKRKYKRRDMQAE